MTVTDDILAGLVADAIRDGATLLGGNVFVPRTWPTEPDGMPIGMVQSPTEEKTSLGRSGAVQFNCVTTVRFVGRVFAKVAGNDQAAIAALAAVGALKRQVEVAVLGNQALRDAGLQKFSWVRSVTDVKTEGGYTFGELVMDFGLEFYQDWSDFHPLDADPFDQVAIYADLINLFSPTGAFDGTPFADEANPSPRTEGPDGRAEGAALITLPQE